MNINLKLILILSLLIMMSGVLFSKTTVTTTTTITVTRADPGGSPPFTSCPFAGVGCTIQTTVTTTTTTPIIMDNATGDWVINANTGPMIGQVGSNQFVLSDRSLVFPNGTTLTILHSDEYPRLDNTVISIAGILASSLGNYTVRF
ncbi:MAG TPA: hypothetical protein PLE30_09100 [Candidatus Kapabacteria bacterium]|nr:hypothetical protein [Candidatus Kapabacteria bacterium]